MEIKDKIGRLDRAFNPRAVVVIGDTKKTKFRWLRRQSELKARLYSVAIDPKGFEDIAALGIKNYLSILDVPDDEIDYVIVAAPRSASPAILKDCIQKGVGCITFYTAGFAETGSEVGIRLQETLAKMANEAGLPIIGPNCMGIFSPKAGLRFQSSQYTGDSGPMGFISQSGTHAGSFCEYGSVNGVKASKVVSIGNCIALEAADYLQYMKQDEETRIIGMYIESVKDGRRFFEVLRETARVKPVLIWKGGQTPQGTRATASHTASLAEPMMIWEAMIKQSGAIRVDSMEEVVDTAKALIYCRPGTGYRMGLISTTGGQSVYITDTFAKAGLDVADLSQESYVELGNFFNIIGAGCKNPIDMGQNTSENLVPEVVSILGRDPKVDAIAVELPVLRLQRHPEMADQLFASLSAFAKATSKPFVIILPSMLFESEAITVRAKMANLGIATYPNFERAAKALKDLIDFYRHRGESTES